MQMADLCARPIGMKIIRPEAMNRAYTECIRPLMRVTLDGVRADDRIKLI